jgi:phosphoribosylanthranilate isomerase
MSTHLPMKPRIKICCISSIDEAKTAIECGASALGFVGKMPSGPGVIDDELIFKIVKTVPPPVGTFLLTSETSADTIIRHYHRTQTNTIQMVDMVADGTYKQLRQSLSAVKLVQVIHVINDTSVDEAIKVSEHVDAVLLDSGNPNLTVKELGGTGRVHNWKLSRKIRESIPIPIFLAGGLKPENVRQALDEVQPYGIDVCCGVRTEGALDRRKLEMFFEAALS